MTVAISFALFVGATYSFLLCPLRSILMNFHGSEWDEPCDERPLDCLGLAIPV